jgi:hypothetical protein
LKELATFQGLRQLFNFTKKLILQARRNFFPREKNDSFLLRTKYPESILFICDETIFATFYK